MIKDIDIKDLKTISIKNGRYQHSYEKMTVIIIHNDKQFSFDIKSNSLMIDLDLLKVFDHSDLFDLKEFLQLPLEQQITYIQDKDRVEHMKQVIKVSDTEFDIKRRAYKTGRTLRRTSFSLQQAIIFNHSQDYTQPGQQIILPINTREFKVFEYEPVLNYSVDHTDDTILYDYFFNHAVFDGQDHFIQGSTYFESCYTGFSDFFNIKIDWNVYAKLPQITPELLKRFNIPQLDIDLAQSGILDHNECFKDSEWIARPVGNRLSLPPFYDEPINAETGERITRTMHLSELREIEKEMKIIDL
jgi:hypothetical protein